MLTPEMQDVLQTFPGSYISAVGANNVPVITRVVGLSVEDGDHVRVHIPRWYSDAFLATIASRPQVAIVGVQVMTYRTFQFKGEVLDHGAPEDADQQTIASYVEGFGNFVSQVGIDAERYNAVYASAPFHTLRVRVDQVFDQTPRVGAGNLIKERSA